MVSSVESDTDDALVDSAGSEKVSGVAGAEPFAVASDSWALEVVDTANVHSEPSFVSLGKVGVVSSTVGSAATAGAGSAEEVGSTIGAGSATGPDSAATAGSTAGADSTVFSASLTTSDGGGGTKCSCRRAFFFFFRSSIAFISRAFSGVIVGILEVTVFVDIVLVNEAPELVAGRPPLVYGRMTASSGLVVGSPSCGGEIIMVGFKPGCCDCGRSFGLLELLENSLTLAGNVDTGL